MIFSRCQGILSDAVTMWKILVGSSLVYRESEMGRIFRELIAEKDL